jgi:Raf kinase inhibitor-like YbhB/YbcL family protein
MEIRTNTFEAGGMIPREYTCDGVNSSPAVRWSGVPQEAVSLALLCEDPDAPSGTWSHWVLFNLPPAHRELPRGVPADARLEGGGLQGRNDFGKLGYGGPCPPRGTTHRYYFRLFVLDCVLDLEPGATRQQVREKMQGHILEQAEWMGRYSRQK